MQQKIPVIAVCGPTASGKTALAVRLAKKYSAEIVSADSMQVYKGMQIGTARPTVEEMDGVPHHLMGFLEPDEKFSVADYVKLAGEAIADIHARGKLAVLAGGTGLYISSLLDGLSFDGAGQNPALREKLAAIARDKGTECLWELLNERDPELAAKLHPNNTGRIIRAIEVYEATGIPMSRHQEQARGVSPYEPLIIGLRYADRQKLYDRIDLRVDKMLEDGLLQEAETLRLSATASQAIGYKELVPYFERAKTLAEAVETIKRETRRYAKRQLTWLRRDSRVCWFDADEYTAEELENAVFGVVDVFLSGIGK